MSDAQALSRELKSLDGRGYKAYSSIKGRWDFDLFSLYVDHVQGDPFAAPSKLRVRVAMADAALPPDLFGTRIRRIALADLLAREVRRAIGASPSDERRGEAREPRSGSGKSGLVSIDAGGQEVLERTAIRLADDFVEARIEVGLPAAGRRILGRSADELLTERLPRIVESALLWESLPPDRARAFVECIENQEHIRGQLDDLGLVAFVGDGSVLPRQSGASERPMAPDQALPFRSPDSHRVSIELPNEVAAGEGRTISGMGIRQGVTLIVGGGYHGKSTLLRALECGVHPHIPGDGREWVVASRELVKIRAEDGRSVTKVDIHPFVRDLPALPAAGREAVPRSTRAFSSEDASGSTSQAAAIVEAIEAGARGLLLDEDTCATNFMLRDARMQQLVHRDHEPITPFVDRVRELYDTHGVSTVIVMGGCGDYFEAADSVIMMREFTPLDVTADAKRIAAQQPSGRRREIREAMPPVTPRSPLAESFVASRGRREVDISTKSRELVVYGRTAIDLRYQTQLLDISQTRAVAMTIHLASQRFMTGRGHEPRGPATLPTLVQVLDAIEALLDDDGLDCLDPFARRGPRAGEADRQHPGSFARPRRFEIAAAINRMRGLAVEQAGYQSAS